SYPFIWANFCHPLLQENTLDEINISPNTTLFPQMLSYARCGKVKSIFSLDNLCLEVHRVPV
ncbi:MAG: hypothetical protein RBS85_03540, partial [Methanofastidiosum sp.]|nr:hypothetical protein [Methanofastidiosum sp.]